MCYWGEEGAPHFLNLFFRHFNISDISAYHNNFLALVDDRRFDLNVFAGSLWFEDCVYFSLAIIYCTVHIYYVGPQIVNFCLYWRVIKRERILKFLFKLPLFLREALLGIRSYFLPNSETLYDFFQYLITIKAWYR